ncbi:transcriptional regulator [Iocasia frigidifontis]|uniref:Transcriptional regulator n=1 Tax=Iocasia fonsfrigidae TaxID=2682810 RepID=A0A8A7KC89_9FIRM|nr:DegT/DnrJ/EryC1/StrS family aminotransferase [Iocasia fonsfrigidae]QTL97695.1 transcriptional regulator [Iocasia fonsfrigidae]
MKIPLLDLRGQYQQIKGEIKAAVNSVLESGQYILGEQVEKLEKEIASYCGVDYAVGVASGTDALLLSLKALEIKPGDEVILPTFTFFATAGVISHLGAIPAFVDIDPISYNIAPEKIKEKITDQTRAIIPVHLFGQPAEMDKIMETAADYNLKVVEDACQAIGAKYQGIQVGNFGNAAALSFFPSKNLGAYGDGGMVLTNDKLLAEKIKRLRLHGGERKYYHQEIGYNSRLDAIQAAILRVKLEYLTEWTDNRQRVAVTYNSAFKENKLDGMVSLPAKKIRDSTHVFHQYVIRTGDRDRLKLFLEKNGVSTGIYYPLPLHLQKCFKGLGYQEGELPVAEKICKQVLALPIDPGLNDEEISYIVKLFASKMR